MSEAPCSAAGTGRGRRERATAVPPPAPAADGADAAEGESESQPEKNLNLFVCILATGELVGNALGTLASLWATVVLLGGYRSSLKYVDFGIATAMVFIEAFRVFIRNFKFDNQSLFGSTKAFRWISSSLAHMLWRPREGSEIVLIIGGAIKIFEPLGYFPFGSYVQVAVLTLMSRMHLAETLTRQLQRGRPLQQWALLVILIPLDLPLDILTQFVALVLLYLRPQRIAALTSGSLGRWLLYLFKGISALLLASKSVLILFPGLVVFLFPGSVSAFATVVLLFGSLQEQVPAVPNSLCGQWIDVIMHVCYLLDLVFPLPIAIGPSGAAISLIVLLAVLLIGNLQIPATIAQIVLSSWRLHSLEGDSPIMVASVKVFYVLVLCQGSVHTMACILALFSFVPRRSLLRRSGFEDRWGAKVVDLYYERAYTTRMEIGVFAEDTISLGSFVADSLNSASSSRELRLAGVRVLHSFLQRRDSNEELISVITRSEKAVPTLISMLGWTFKQDRDIRLFAAKVTAELSCDLRIAGIPGAVKLVSSLLDAENQTTSKDDEGNGDDGLPGPHAADGNQETRGTTRNERPPVNSHDLPLTSQDSLPILGMVILERLACDPDKCAEIVKTTNLIPKIICHISYSSSNSESSNDDNALISSSLNLVRRIATTSGRVGATLRQELVQPFLLSNLACILEDSRSGPQVWKPATDIIATLALDEGPRHELGSVQVIIHKPLLHIFVIGGDGSTDSLRVAAGGALANLAMESPENCLAMLEERQRYGYDLVKDLKGMLGDVEYRCVAASVLHNLCATIAACSRIKDWLSDPGVTSDLSSALPVGSMEHRRRPLQNIMAADGKQLVALIGLASQIYYVLPPQPFVQGLESHNIGAPFVRKLVHTLNSNRKPSHEYPRMRRTIVEMVISVLRRYPGYAIIFKREGMIDALSKVETTPSKVENYRVFLGNEGVVLEPGLPPRDLRDLAATAKDLIHPATPT
ncbi:unnamed protein product [Urochloa decumbens]|uniref:Uncharacterized protein n=1 Tax=Urochloa decumbens TaxID=240449 RepID=A0ABC9BRE1_9POAL